MNLNEYIESRQFEQKEFAKLIGVSVRTLAYILAGKTMPKAHVIWKIMEVTNGKVDISDIVKFWREKNESKKDQNLYP
jgi:transcriptional regulator with XRE-family HTH domain